MENNGLVVYFNCLRLIFQCLLVSLCPKANAEMVPNTPRCHCTLLMQPSRLKFLRSLFHTCGPGSSVGIATDYELDGPGSNPGGDEISARLDQPWGPPNLL